DISVSPLSMVTTIVQLILVPLLIGMALHAKFPKITAVLKKPVRMLSMAIFIGFVIFALYANYDNIINYLYIVFYLVVIHNAVALISGYQWALRNGLPQADARAISIETGIQNSGLALILIFNFFDGLGGMALVAAFWGVWHLISAFSLAMWWQFRPITPEVAEP
ncbi:MAG: bile acid:sodium symporter family protein, partial [Phaeodactylibacter sp.]|nr:bile acid:sodium symporter family protein [Phaeodactylibacter sp.]